MKLDNTFIEYAGDILADTNYGLSGSEIIRLCNAYAMDFNKKIPYDDKNNIKPNKRTALKENLRVFELQEQLQIIKELCENDKICEQDKVQELKLKLFIRYKGHFNTGLAEEINKQNITLKNNQWLKNYPRALKQYESAMQKYRAGIFSRNIIDDLRLAFELLVKDLFNSEAPLEKQISKIGEMLEGAGVSKELRNMLPHLIDLYTKYQNNNVKHNDLVNDSDVPFIFKMTTIFMEYLIQNKK